MFNDSSVLLNHCGYTNVGMTKIYCLWEETKFQKLKVRWVCSLLYSYCRKLGI